jgi:hypothetical protein
MRHEVQKSAYFLERIFDYVKRDRPLWGIELLPHIVEIYTHEKPN